MRHGALSFQRMSHRDRREESMRHTRKSLRSAIRVVASKVLIKSGLNAGPRRLERRTNGFGVALGSSNRVYHCLYLYILVIVCQDKWQ